LKQKFTLYENPNNSLKINTNLNDDSLVQYAHSISSSCKNNPNEIWMSLINEKENISNNFPNQSKLQTLEKFINHNKKNSISNISNSTKASRLCFPLENISNS